MTFFDEAMEFARATHLLSETAFKLTGQEIKNIVLDVRHPPFATMDWHPTTFQRMWRWGTFSGVVLWSAE